MALNMQQQITIPAWTITYANDRETARREFNVALQPSTVGKRRKRLLETGRMQKIKPLGRPRISTDAETTERIVEPFDASPQKSSRQTARELHISQSSVCREKYYPFKPIRVHELNEDDPDRRMEFCEFVVRESANDEHWYRKLHFSDEAVFQVNGRVNRHYCHYYGKQNPNVIEETRLRCGKVTVWAMIGGEGLLGMQILDETVNGDRFSDNLRQIVLPVMLNMNNVYSSRMVCLLTMQLR